MFRRSLAALKQYASDDNLARSGRHAIHLSRAHGCFEAQGYTLTLTRRTFSTTNPHKSSHPILTLLPEKLSSVKQPLLSLSNLKFKTTHAAPPVGQQLSPVDSAQSERAKGSVAFGKHHVQHDTDTLVSKFPSNTEGFFYYHRLPDRPEISGQIRFRLCRDPASFDHGQDLAYDSGTPWSISLVDTLQQKNKPFYSVLLQDGIITESFVEDMKNLQHSRRSAYLRLYSLSDPFDFQLSQLLMRVHLITREHGDTLFMLRRIWIDRRRHISTEEGKRVEKALYTGAVKARFELSTLPEHKKLGPALVLRTLEITEPVQCLIPDYDGYVPPPVVGRLHGRMVKGRLIPWVFPLLRSRRSRTGESILAFLQHSRGAIATPTTGNAVLS